jgi:hypothetical protein
MISRAMAVNVVLSVPDPSPAIQALSAEVSVVLSSISADIKAQTIMTKRSARALVRAIHIAQTTFRPGDAEVGRAETYAAQIFNGEGLS